jgi:hypothetical protein
MTHAAATAAGNEPRKRSSTNPTTESAQGTPTIATDHLSTTNYNLPESNNFYTNRSNIASTTAQHDNNENTHQSTQHETSYITQPLFGRAPKTVISQLAPTAVVQSNFAIPLWSPGLNIALSKIFVEST